MHTSAGLSARREAHRYQNRYTKARVWVYMDARVLTDGVGVQTGGHLGSSLGVVELTTALLHVFNLPDDKIVYDVGHQAYVHKMLTGRRKQMSTIRQLGGLSGAQLPP